MIFIVVPVYNRLNCLKDLVEDLEEQQFTEELKLVIVDSGSTDGTVEFVKSEMRDSTFGFPMELLIGSPSWWWGRATAEGIKYCRADLGASDFVLLLNDDVRLPRNYLLSMMKLANSNPKCLVTSALKANLLDEEPFHYGVLVDEQNLNFVDVPSHVGATDPEFFSDVCSGRGTLIPAAAILDGVTARHRKFPHYLADYDIGIQSRKNGFLIVGSREVWLVAHEVQGNAKRYDKLTSYLFKKESPGRLISWFFFWIGNDMRLPRRTRIRSGFRLVRRQILGKSVFENSED
jgi:GT2 family glycosyltransferase